MQYYEKNMEILKKRFKPVYNAIKKAEENELFTVKKIDEDDLVSEIIDKENDFIIYIEKARRGGFAMKIKKEEKEIYFHSKYAPEREAKKIVKDFGFSSKKQVFVLGVGLGYYLKQFNNQNKYDKIIVIEPFLSIFYAALCFNDLSQFLGQDNIVLILENDNILFDIIRAYIKINLAKDIDFLEHSPSLNLFWEKYQEVYKKTKEAIDYSKVGLITDIKKARMWRNNIIKNLLYISKNPKVDDFFGRFEDVPIICVSAGPSLDKNIEELKRVNNRALIMCVGTALKALLKHNIKPDIVVSMEGNNPAYKQFKDLTYLQDVYLFAELGNYHLIQNEWKGPQVFFTMKRNFSGWVEELNGEYTVIQTGGTVAHSMVDLAYKLGANPIILVGQDLAYSNKGKTHASGTFKENKKIEESKNELFEVDDIDDKKVLTSKAFMTMLSFFNNYFNKRKDRLFIDATEGGAKIENTKIMKLDNVLKKYCNNKIDTRKKLDDLYSKLKEKIELESKLKRKIKYTISELKESIKITERQIKAMNRVKEQLNKKQNLSAQELDDLELSFSKFEDNLNDTKYLSYFIERILIAESMKLDRATSKYYMSKQDSLEKRLKAYYNFRTKFLVELKKSLSLLEKLYLTEKDNITLKNDFGLEEREGLA